MPVNKDFYTLAGSSGQSTGYEIANSLRFNDDDSGFLLDAGTDAGDTRKKNTWSVWVKRGNLSSAQYIAAYRYDATNYQYLLFKADNKFEFTDVTGGSVQSKVVTAREFRDPAAWYHIVCVWDTADGVAGNRARVYVNGVRETSLNTGTYPSQNADSGGAGRADARLRFGTYDATGNYLDGYLAEVHYTDNYAYDPSNFGEFKEDTDIWIPKEADVSYGSAGAYLDFETSGTLGANAKGKGNFSLSGVASHDQMTDTPTNNFAVMNILDNFYASSGFREGNLKITHGGSSVYTFNQSTMAMTSGKWYAEVDCDDMDSTLIGVAGQSSAAASHILGTKTDQFGYYGPDGTYYNNNSQTSYGNSYATGDIIGIALDLDNNKLYFSKNGTWQNSGDPTSGSTGTGALSIPAASATFNGSYTFAFGDFSNSSATSIANFGQDGTFAGNVSAGGNSDGNGIGNFKYPVPSGYLALCTKNLGS